MRNTKCILSECEQLTVEVGCFTSILQGNNFKADFAVYRNSLPINVSDYRILIEFIDEYDNLLQIFDSNDTVSNIIISSDINKINVITFKLNSEETQNLTGNYSINLVLVKDTQVFAISCINFLSVTTSELFRNINTVIKP